MDEQGIMGREQGGGIYSPPARAQCDFCTHTDWKYPLLQEVFNLFTGKMVETNQHGPYSRRIIEENMWNPQVKLEIETI